MECMKSFLRFIRNIRDPNGKHIRVAVIDDGVDNALDIFEDRIGLGKSFCPYPNSTELMSGYYVPSSTHGTVMASLICQMCPMVKLYIARIEDDMGRRGKRLFTAKSAAEVCVRFVEIAGDVLIHQSGHPLGG